MERVVAAGIAGGKRRPDVAVEHGAVGKGSPRREKRGEEGREKEAAPAAHGATVILIAARATMSSGVVFLPPGGTAVFASTLMARVRCAV